jgi:hypothetical protein
MNTTDRQQAPQQAEDTREMRKWARIYAQNRSLGVVVFMVAFVGLFLAISVPSYFGGQAYRSGNAVLLWVCIAILVPAMGATVFLSVPGWGGAWIERVTRRLYAREGDVSLCLPHVKKRRRVGMLLVIGLGLCVFASIALGFLDVIPQEYQQPVSALYMVPFLVAITLLLRPAVSYLALLWPALYALHAILIVLGAPILFTGPWEALNMLIPNVGYGILSALVSHAYSRFALHRLRRLAGEGLADRAAEGEEPQR